MSNVLVTGANGFIGRKLCGYLEATGYKVRRAVRAARAVAESEMTEMETVAVGDIGPETDWDIALQGIDTVVHLAARVHVMDDPEADPLAAYRLVNTAGTVQLAQSAARLGVKRFVFLSTVKVNGETTEDHPFTEHDPPAPQDPYAVSKLEAENNLHELATKTGIEVVVIRPPLVYGPGVKGNFLTMIKWVAKGVPLPFGAVRNKRSLVAVDNLVDLIAVSLKHPAASNQIFLAADGEDLSTAELLQQIGLAMDKPVRLFVVPVGLIQSAVVLVGKAGLGQRLLDSLQVDISKVRSVLGWEPPISIDEGFERCVSHVMSERKNVHSVLMRFFDIVLSLSGLIITFPLLVVLILVGLLDTGSPIFTQQRVGRYQQPFMLIKFRTMKLDTASVATHLATSSSITRLGHFLRRTKLDELPQLWNVLIGEMSLIGPRPCLFNQDELIRERAAREVFNVRPGITGLAQVNKIDMSTPVLLAEMDKKMIIELTLGKYFSYIMQTVFGKGSGDRVIKD